MQPMQLCILSAWSFEEKFKNTRRRKDKKQMQLVRVRFFLCKPFENTFEKTQWRKVEQMQPVYDTMKQSEETLENALFIKMQPMVKCNL